MTETPDASTDHAHPRRPLPWLTWWFSALFGVAIIAALATLVYSQTTSASTVNLTIIDSNSDAPLADAWIYVDDRAWKTDEKGQVNLPEEVKNSPFEVSRDGFVSWRSDAGVGKTGSFTIELAKANDPPVAPTPTAGIDPTESPTTGAIASPTLEPTTEPTTEPTNAPASPPATPDATPRSASLIEGVITDASGEGIQGARVIVGDIVEVTGKDGLFSFDLDVSGDDVRARVIASGFLDQEIALQRDGAPLTIGMEPHKIKAIYLNPNLTETEEDIDRLVDMINDTELNAVVIDVKEELIYYESEVEFFVDAGTVQPRYDIEEMLARFQEHGIYTIARLVVFKDSIVAEERRDLAVLNNQTGDLWRDMNGVAWVNPMNHELWEANTDLALEAALHGFDEIQFDYVRFPTDGDLTTMDFGLENTQEIRERSIEKFLQMAQEKVHPTGAKLSADVFGYTMLVEDDLGIGQNFINLAQYVDYLSPMIYPSHFPDGSIDVDGHPNSFPYETIEISLRNGRDKLDGDADKIRPWLQDFSFFDMMPYGDAEVRAQIDASDDIGTSGWMLWDPNNQYHPGALDPDAGDQQSTLPVIPQTNATPTTDVRVRRRVSVRR